MRVETFSTPGPVRLDLELPAGQIEIETRETDETHVELEAVSSNEQVREMVEAARIESFRRGDVYEVTVEVRTRHGVWISLSRIIPPLPLASTLQSVLYSHYTCVMKRHLSITTSPTLKLKV